jgi:glycosidase
MQIKIDLNKNFTNISFQITTIIIFFLISMTATVFSQSEKSFLKHPTWSYNKTIYEVNLRQYSKSGTFKGFEKRLPELKKMGIGILWFMPINPIGVKNRKGKLGSYYSVQNYLAVDSAYGTINEFKKLVKKIHSMGMYVILDWVADHTSWDNVWTKEHPDFYRKDSLGNFVPPVKDWTDVIALNYKNKELWDYMTKAMEFWVKECNIDGFRCDVADMVPTPFWDQARVKLDKIKPVFMLAEAEKPALQVKAFDMTYSWKLYSLMNSIAKGKKNAENLIKYFKWDDSTFPQNDFRMRFTTNHDENSWNGTVFERLGDAAPTFAALTFAVKGMPLIYSGQEAGLNKRLKFFDRDPIDWKPSKFSELYTKLVHLKLKNKALWSGDEGGNMVMIPSSNEKAVYSFIREKDNDKVFMVFNLSAKPVDVKFNSELIKGNYLDLFANKLITLTSSEKLNLKPWGFKFFVKK